MQIKKQQLELDTEQWTVPAEKGVHQGCILSSFLFNFYAEYIMHNAGLDDQAGVNINIKPGEISITSYADENMQSISISSLEKYQQPQICR